ncbi:transmembrane protein 79-like [Narcine bancroftii]|uniref:transmembrane protein 79-like n=1 Tax=Narcine bancroftii TaxID=1343680 RepID=UPI003831AFEE
MTAPRQPANSHELKEFDNVKESITDIINQLQDIDPSRLSFSPFLDLDTQITLAPISDSPESSVEELHSLPDESIEHLTEPAPKAKRLQFNEAHLKLTKQQSAPSEGRLNMIKAELVRNHTFPYTETKPKHPGNVSLDITRETSVLPDGEVSFSEPPLPSEAETLRPPKVGVESIERLEKAPKLTSQASEDQPLLGPSPDAETIELISSDSERNASAESSQKEPATAANGGWKCCPCSRCCSSSHLKAVSSVFVALLFIPWIIYGLYMFVPIESPPCPDLTSRITYTLRCNIIAISPVLLGVVMGSLSRLCSTAIDPLDTNVRAVLIHQRYVGNSIEQFTIYFINMAVMATYLHQEHLKIIPILCGLFAVARLLYWITAGLSSAYRGFGFGLTFFPTLAMLAYNCYCIYELGLDHYFIPPESGGPTRAPAPRLRWWGLGG